MAAEYGAALPITAFLLERTADLQRLADDLHIDGHRGGEIAGNAVCEQPLGNCADAFLLAVAHILAEIAVNVQVDQTGGDVTALCVDNFDPLGQLVGGNDAFDNIRIKQRAVFDNAVFKNYPAVDDSLHYTSSV